MPSMAEDNWWDEPMMDEEVELRLVGSRSRGNYERSPEWVHVVMVGNSATLFCRRVNPTTAERETRLEEMIMRYRK